MTLNRTIGMLFDRIGKMELADAVKQLTESTVRWAEDTRDLEAAIALLDFARRAADALRCYDNITAPPGFQADLSIIQSEARPLVEEARAAGLLEE